MNFITKGLVGIFHKKKNIRNSIIFRDFITSQVQRKTFILECLLFYSLCLRRIYDLICSIYVKAKCLLLCRPELTQNALIRKNLKFDFDSRIRHITTFLLYFKIIFRFVIGEYS